MFPTHERVEGDVLSGPQLDDRLILEPKLARLERTPQIGLEFRAADNVGSKLRLEHAEAGSIDLNC